jgi:hypothetical protein
MRAVASVDAFIADRCGSYRVASHHLVWCSDVTLGGDSDVEVETLAHELGCRSVASFAQLFRRVTGEAPRELRGRATPALTRP